MEDLKLLNLGCGEVLGKKPCWVNVDKDDTYITLTPVGEHRYTTMCMDFTSNPFVEFIREYRPDGVLLSHVLEHFDLQGAYRILEMIYYALPTGGVVRISVPSCEKLIKGGFPLGMQLGNCMWEDHKTMFDVWCLTLITKLIGYRYSIESEPNESPIPHLAELDNREDRSLFFEAIK